MKILLDYLFPITAIIPTPAASTAYLKQACLVVKPADTVPTGVATRCTNMSQVAALTDNTEASEFFAAGLSSVYILPMASLDLAAALAAEGNKFFTTLVSSDFNDGDIASLAIGAYKGVVGISTQSDVVAKAEAVKVNRVAFISSATTKAKNMCFAFGKLLSNRLNWINQQYIQVPYSDDIDALGDANQFFDDKISFVITDEEFGTRLGLFAAGGKAIIAPYVTRNLEVDLQSKALQYISANNPSYSLTQASLLEDELQKVVDSYILRQWIEQGEIRIKLENENFVASGYINISEPNALWRIFGELRQTL